MPIQLGINAERNERLWRDKINAERDRRIEAGFLFEGNLYQFREQDRARITGAATLAGFAIGQGAAAGNFLWHGGTDPFSWILSDNSVVQLDAPTTFTLGQAAAHHESVHVFAAKTLKEMTPNSVDPTDDTYWPVSA